MGISYVEGTVRGPTGREARVRFLIDSGAIYSLLPNAVWKEIGLTATREMEFALADGTAISRPVSECQITLPQGPGGGHTPVVLGEPGDPDVKIPHYARRGIPEAWLIDLERDAITCYRTPGPDGYEEIVTVNRGATLRPVGLPELAIDADEILG